MGPGPDVRPTQTPQKPLWLEEPSLAETSGLAPLAGSTEKVLERECQLGVGRGSAGPPPHLGDLEPKTWTVSAPELGLLSAGRSPLCSHKYSNQFPDAHHATSPWVLPRLLCWMGRGGGSCLSPAAPPSPALVSLCSSTCLLRSPLRKNPRSGCPLLPSPATQASTAFCW